MWLWDWEARAANINRTLYYKPKWSFRHVYFYAHKCTEVKYFLILGIFPLYTASYFHAGNETEYNKHKSLRLTEHIGFKTQALTLIALQRPLAQGNCWFSSAVFNQHCKVSLRQTGEAALHLYPGSLGYKYNTVSILKNCICLYAAGSNYKQANLLWKMVWPSLWWKSDDGF